MQDEEIEEAIKTMKALSRHEIAAMLEELLLLRRKVRREATGD